MKRLISALLSLALLTLLSACSSQSDIENTEAVRTAIVEYLLARQGSTGLDPDAMDIGVEAVAFERNVAHATVAFLIPGTDQGMQFNYTLDREGDKWVVRERQDATGTTHGVPDPDLDAPVDPGSLLPPPSSEELPVGHPTVAQ